MEGLTLRRIIEFALRVFSYVFTAASGVVLLGLGIVGKSSGDVLTLQSMSWKGSELTMWLMILGITGILAAALAAFTKGSLRYLLPVWAVIFAYLSVKGNLMSPAKSFASVDEFQWTVAFVVGAVVSALSSLLVFKKKKKK